MLRLRWFIRLRWFFLLAVVAVLVLEGFLLGSFQRPLPLAGCVVVLGAVNLVWMAVSHSLFRRVHERPEMVCALVGRQVVFANGQVAVDLLVLTGILRYTGGAENPLAIFYLFHMAIVSLLLKRWQALLQGLWALLLYATLVIGEWQAWLTPHYWFLPHCLSGVYAQAEYVFAALLVVACGISGMLYFTLHIAERIAKRERELQRANAALRQSQQAIADLQQRRWRFMQTAAHQLKSPLAVVQTLTELIRSNVVPAETVSETCDKIVRRCQDGIAQVSELLTLARVQDADAARHRQSQTGVRDVVAELCRRFKPLAERAQVELRCQMPADGGLAVSVHPQDLKDCVANLIENAIRCTPGPGTVTVAVTPKLSHGKLVDVAINVTDTGMGIDPDLLEPADGQRGGAPLFDAFRRGDNVIAAGIPGTGLGLSIVREVVEQAGGRLKVHSRRGRGTSFTVTFPAYGSGTDQPPVRDTRASEVVLEEPDDAPAA